MKSSCASCPFGPKGDPEIRESVTDRIMKFENSQICHHPVLHGKKETHLCRGARDLQLQVLVSFGMLDEATDKAFAEKSRQLGVVK